MVLFLNHSIIGLIVLLCGVVYKFFQPKEINSFYGFRTEKSIKSKEIWEKANRYCANKLVEAGVILTIIGGINSIVLPEMYSLFSLIIAGPLLIFVVIKTNKFIS